MSPLALTVSRPLLILGELNSLDEYRLCILWNTLQFGFEVFLMIRLGL